MAMLLWHSSTQTYTYTYDVCIQNRFELYKWYYIPNSKITIIDRSMNSYLLCIYPHFIKMKMIKKATFWNHATIVSIWKLKFERANERREKQLKKNAEEEKEVECEHTHSVCIVYTYCIHKRSDCWSEHYLDFSIFEKHCLIWNDGNTTHPLSCGKLN